MSQHITRQLAAGRDDSSLQHLVALALYKDVLRS